MLDHQRASVICAFPFHKADAELLCKMLLWIARLGPNTRHEAVLIGDGAVDAAVASELVQFARKTFGSVRIHSIPHVQGWIEGSNALFRYAAQLLQGKHFLWIEPDAVPLYPGWLDRIEDARAKSKKQFLGSLVTHTTPGLPSPYFEGCGVYPSNTWELIHERFDDKRSWTLACAPVVVPLAQDCPLFQHLWGEPNLSPTFVAEGVAAPRNGFRLRDLRPGAALFHRCKDASLLNLLHKKFFPEDSKFEVVLPIFERDAAMALQDLQWLSELHAPASHSLTLFYERTMNGIDVRRILEAAKPSFAQVLPWGYDPTDGPNKTWIAACHVMKSRQKPWFWWEPDCIPIKADCFNQLQHRYDISGALFLGPVVPDMQHCNGTAVYPADTPSICPKVMQTRERFGFDVHMRPEMIHLCADCSDLIQHVWVERGAVFFPHGHGEQPTFPTVESLNRVSRRAAFFHRCKSMTLIARLRERRAAHG